MKRGKTLLALFWEFFQFGCFTFGGGWSIVAQMQRLYVEKRKTITGEELLDITSVGRSLPGTMIGNVAMLYGNHAAGLAGAMLYGNHAAGLAGGVVCLVAMILPPFLILSVLTLCYTAVRDNYWVMAAMTGVRAAIVPIMASAALNLVKGAFRYPPCVAVAAASFALYLIWDVNCVFLVLMGIAAGLAICEVYERRGGNGDGAA